MMLPDKVCHNGIYKASKKFLFQSFVILTGFNSCGIFNILLSRVIVNS